MSGVGGPLLCIGDLLSDVGEDGDFTIGTVSDESTNSGTAQQLNNLSDPNKLQPSHLPRLFQERFNLLDEALSGIDHTWTAPTLKLCTALETANKLVQTTNAHVETLSENVEKLQKIINRRDSTVEVAKKAIQASLISKQ